MNSQGLKREAKISLCKISSDHEGMFFILYTTTRSSFWTFSTLCSTPFLQYFHQSSVLDLHTHGSSKSRRTVVCRIFCTCYQLILWQQNWICWTNKTKTGTGCYHHLVEIKWQKPACLKQVIFISFSLSKRHGHQNTIFTWMQDDTNLKWPPK